MRYLLFFLPAVVILAACADPMAPETYLAGEYRAVGWIESGVVDPGDLLGSAVMILEPDRRWTHVDGWAEAIFGPLSGRYNIQGRDERGLRLYMFEGPVLGGVPAVAFVRGDTLEWGGMAYVRER